MSDKPLRIGIVAGEVSGDIIASELMKAIVAQHPQVEFIGIAGPRMQALGCRVVATMDDVSVIGLMSTLLSLPKLFRIRRDCVQQFVAEKIDIFIGIDFTEFNLSLEGQLRKHHIKTAHYKSPSVWAWRRGRLKKIAKAVNLMLALFPFEVPIYKENNMPVTFVGHPMADTTPLVVDKDLARKTLGLDRQAKIIALLPGSRSMEISQLGRIFVETAQQCLQEMPDLQFICPVVNAKRRQQFQAILTATAPTLPITLIDGKAETVLSACDVALIASGTATFQAMLLKKPMVVAYRLDRISYYLIKTFVKFYINYFALPNLLANERVVPEYLQNDIDAKIMATDLLRYFRDPDHTRQIQNLFSDLHHKLRLNASKTAATAILALATS